MVFGVFKFVEFGMVFFLLDLGVGTVVNVKYIGLLNNLL